MQSKIKAVIVDDERDSLEAIEEQIKMYCEQVELLGIFDDPLVALSSIKSLQPDLAFLDIQMPKMNGLDLAKAIAPFGTQVIFITAHREYAIHAIKLSALDYFLKPIEDPEELKAAVAKINVKQNQHGQLPVLNQLLNNNTNQHFSQETEIALADNTFVHFYKIKDIVRLKAEKNYCHFFFTENRKKLVSKNMGYYTKSLQAYGIVQVNRFELINLAHRKAIIKSGPYLLLNDGHKALVSDKYKNNVPFFGCG